MDDDEDDREIIDEAFKEIGYEAEVKKFIDGVYMMRYLEKIQPSLYPSLIVLDSTLVKEDAINILSALKQDDRYQGIPVIVYSTSISPQKRKLLMEMGAYSCIEKGSIMSEIIEVAKKLKDLAEANIKEPNPNGHA
ncbi:MAG: response regulator [Flavisolibacter sp.]